jgi:pimeloyl-ACP methyl ester carboxylesterase
MSDHCKQLAELPVGFERFHRNAFLNYQLNRAHALGFADRRELRDAARALRVPADCVGVFAALSERAEAEDRLRQATSYLRIAEFFTPKRSGAGISIYRRYRSLFDRAFGDGGATRHDVPYAGSTLPAYRLRSTEPTSRGTVLLHGGFDSLIEEFYAIWERFAASGFDVIAFEGPGQGGARALAGLVFDHDWEKPVSAVLDHLGIERAAIVGMSMGGYWALRAASREPRIDRVVSWPPVYDWLYQLPAPVRAVARRMFRFRRFMNWSIEVRARLFPVLRHAVDHTLYLIDGDEPMQVADWFLGMNAEHLGSDRVTQDVLLCCGEHDNFQPPILARRQAEALTSARSVQVRTFTAAEHADSHCQMGNLDLACRVVTTWLRDGRVLPARSGVSQQGKAPTRSL